MRVLPIAVAALSSWATLSPALALSANDTMSAWKGASDKERSGLLDEVLGKGAGTGKVLQCMDETSKVSGHGDLPIAEVAKACASPKNGDQPV